MLNGESSVVRLENGDVTSMKEWCSRNYNILISLFLIKNTEHFTFSINLGRHKARRPYPSMGEEGMHNKDNCSFIKWGDLFACTVNKDLNLRLSALPWQNQGRLRLKCVAHSQGALGECYWCKVRRTVPLLATDSMWADVLTGERLTHTFGQRHTGLWVELLQVWRWFSLGACVGNCSLVDVKGRRPLTRTLIQRSDSQSESLNLDQAELETNGWCCLDSVEAC